MIAQFPIENHAEQGQFAEPPLKTIGESAKNWAIIMQFVVAAFGRLAWLSACLDFLCPLLRFRLTPTVAASAMDMADCSVGDDPEEASVSGTATWTLQKVPEKHTGDFEKHIGKTETETLTGTLIGRQVTLKGEVQGGAELIVSSDYSASPYTPDLFVVSIFR